MYNYIGTSYYRGNVLCSYYNFNVIDIGARTR